jgi:hypothetical protein
MLPWTPRRCDRVKTLHILKSYNRRSATRGAIASLFDNGSSKEMQVVAGRANDWCAARGPGRGGVGVQAWTRAKAAG